MYRNCDNVWSLVFKKMEITFNDQSQPDIAISPDNKVKIVACENQIKRLLVLLFVTSSKTQH